MSTETTTQHDAERMPHRDAQQRARASEHDASGRISMVEAVAYTAFLGLVAAVASGVFDPMLPWR
ncbi:hypothetical protein QT381_13170 [Galbitalea sp. SE-J8]|uniref:hypothetical protein n=1 Tax=Galbitalea sp. SE-J8 TaxID=3054952 RepID=UPI00259CEF98|nr:hypothetical protein [Galbitalea sp. SE-J8]MDM4763959.1 hypothetical protein [Galbitalea sp. SE-J8]